MLPHTVRSSWPTPPIIIIYLTTGLASRASYQEHPDILLFKLSTAICEYPCAGILKAPAAEAEGTDFTDPAGQRTRHPPDITKTNAEMPDRHLQPSQNAT